MAKDFLAEAALVDLDDGDLKEFLGATYHEIKNLDEAKKNDPDIEQMREALKRYIDDNYTEQEKALKARMKAARTLAEVRGIKWKLPEGT